MARKSNHLEYVEKVYELVGDDYTVLETYVKSNVKLLTRHNVCGNEWPINPNKFLMGRRCPKCGRKSVADRQRKSIEELKIQVKSLTDDVFEIIDCKCRTNRSVAIILHRACNRSFYMQVSNFLTRLSCPLCNHESNAEKKRKKHSEFVEEIFGLYGKEYEVLGEYKTSKDHVLMRHFCGCEWLVTPSNILRGFGCPRCASKRTSIALSKTLETFKEEVDRIGYGEYEIAGKYMGNRIKLPMKHLICGNIWDVTPGNFIKGRGCPYCAESSNGEKRMKHFFKNNHIPITNHFSFPDCKNKNPLSFDAMILGDSGDPILIEYQGVQHYKPSKFFGGEETFISQQLRDKIKFDYCQQHNFKLIIIPYWEYENIEKILESELFPLLERRMNKIE